VINALAAGVDKGSGDGVVYGTTLRSSRRAFDDAVDGVSLLIFHAAKGVKGRLHSKGVLIWEIVLERLSFHSSTDNDTKTDAVAALADSTLNRLLSFAVLEHVSGVWDAAWEAL